MKKIFNYKFLFASVLSLGILAVLINSQQIKITVVNSFSETLADSTNYHSLSVDDNIKNFSELYTEGKKTFVYINSSWCSLCDIISTRLRDYVDSNSQFTIYEADLDEYRTYLSEYDVISAQKLILIEKDTFKVINVTVDNINQSLATEI